jgi:glycosyltransferase involved in cell wall biosynthesis
MSAVRRSVLWVTPQPPDLVMGGGPIRQAHFLTAVAAAADVDLLVASAQSLSDDTVRAACRSVIEHSVPPDFGGGAIGARLGHLRSALGPEGPREVFIARRAALVVKHELTRLDAAQRYDAVVMQHAAFSRLLPAQRRGRWMSELDRLGSIDMRQLREITTGRRQRWLHGREERSSLRLERWIAEHFDAVIGVSDDDLAGLPGHKVVIPNGVDSARFTASPLPAAPRIVMTGHLSTLPNSTGAQWLCREVFPAVREAAPDARLDIVGAAPPDDVRKLAELPGVEVHADVPDVVPYLSSARVAVVPLVMGSGTRLKALEAFAAGRPLVGTTVGLIGLGIVDGESALVADSPADFAAAVVRLLREDALAAKLIDQGRQIAKRHEWSALAERYVAAVLDS